MKSSKSCLSPLLLFGLVLLILSVGKAAAQNVLTNPGFETGDTSGWFAFGSPTLAVETSQVHSGTYACLVTNRAAISMGIAQSLVGVLQAGQTYSVSAWLQMASGTSETVYLMIQKTDGSGTSSGLIAVSGVSSTTWTHLSGTYTYNPSGTVTGLNFYVEVSSSSNAAYYIDDVEFNGGNTVSNPPINGVSTVDWNNVHQRIDGFGASSAWNGSWNTAEADLLFSTNNNVSFLGKLYNGAGLSLLRNRIVNAGSTSASATPTTVETSIMKMAAARGARVWSTPWTPPAGFKNTNDIYDSGIATGNGVNGGSFRGGDATNQAYASQLANYVVSMKNQGINLYAISIQNEPDAAVTTYEACQWTGTQIHDFVTNLYNALAAKGVGSTKIMLPESQNWPDYRGFASTTMRDSVVAADVGIIADHNYDGLTGPSSLAKNSYGKDLWETEVAILSGSDPSITNGVYYAQRIYLFMTQAQVNAFHYWWLVDTGNGGLLSTSTGPAKRLFAFGQYSRFVRPNFYRINATSSQPSALISAYKSTNSGSFAIVVVNTNVATDVIQTFNLAHFTAASVTPWITSDTLSLAPQTSVNVTNSSFTYDVPALSIVTFVGQATPPSLVPVPAQTINVGQTVQVTNTAVNPDANTLTFSLLSNPAGAMLTSLNTSNALFSWRAPVSKANTTNPVKIAVTDNGTGLSATNNFNVFVNAVTNPVINSVVLSPGQVSLTVNGPQGPDYTLLTSTNILDWQMVFTTNSPAMPYTYIDTNLDDPARFYRFQIGP